MEWGPRRAGPGHGEGTVGDGAGGTAGADAPLADRKSENLDKDPMEWRTGCAARCRRSGRHRRRGRLRLLALVGCGLHAQACCATPARLLDAIGAAQFSPSPPAQTRLSIDNWDCKNSVKPEACPMECLPSAPLEGRAAGNRPTGTRPHRVESCVAGARVAGSSVPGSGVAGSGAAGAMRRRITRIPNAIGPAKPPAARAAAGGGLPRHDTATTSVVHSAAVVPPTGSLPHWRHPAANQGQQVHAR
jgi:hypothetical protein